MHEEMALAHALGQRRDLEDSNSKIRLDKSCSEERRSNPRHTTSLSCIDAGGESLLSSMLVVNKTADITPLGVSSP